MRTAPQVEIVAFSDEEGVRFQSTFLGSKAVAGTLPPAALNWTDDAGTTLAEVWLAATAQLECGALTRRTRCRAGAAVCTTLC
jgi:allantoate deiminase